MKKHFRIILAMMMAMMLALLAGCNGGSESESSEEPVPQEPAAEEEQEPEQEVPGIGIHHAEIVIEGYGTVTVELDGDKAPITVKNFMDLANSGFYDGLTFHRIIDGFMIQGGDPLGNGTGGSDKNIPGEFADNGYQYNDITHVKGVISMARSQDPNSASSQFFIMVEAAPHLDGQYAAFGHVIEGQEIVDQIAAEAQPLDGNGTIAPEDQPVITTIKITD